VSAAIIIRTYKAGSQSQAAAQFARDAQNLARYGYVPVSQSWEQGTWGCGAFLVALLLCVVLVGILIFIYMLIVKPEGSLTVTYRLEASRPWCPRCHAPLDMGQPTCGQCGMSINWQAQQTLPPPASPG
jgi:hypothetical protein